MWKQATVTVSLRLWTHCDGSGVRHKLLRADMLDWVASGCLLFTFGCEPRDVSLGEGMHIHTVYSAC